MSMKEIRELASKRNENRGGNKTFKNNDIYPFWLMDAGDEAIIRFLPDKNTENPWPFIEKLEHKLPINGSNRKIACPKMYGHNCAICDKSKEYYDAEGDDSENGKFYYRDRMHLGRALILKDPLDPATDDDGQLVDREGKVYTVQLGFQIYEKIMGQLADFFDDDDPLPWDLDEGFNFKIKPVKQGSYKKYDLSSTFEKKSSTIPDEYLENIEIVDLRTLLPEEIDYDKSNEFYAQHTSGGVGNSDSLESKKNKSSGSARKSALDRMKNEDDDDDNDAAELDGDDKAELASTVAEAKASDADDADDADDSDDDDDDGDDALQAIINRRKKNKAKK